MLSAWEEPDAAIGATVEQKEPSRESIEIHDAPDQTSMTTSDPESLPRNVDFFFSRNRLNVAISRSQCLSIVIMNKKILDIACKKIKHIRLVNTFMKLLKYLIILILF